MAEYKTINVKKSTWKDLNKLKIEKEYSSIDELINQELEFE